MVFDPSISLWRLGFANRSKILAAGASITIRADLILESPVSIISARTLSPSVIIFLASLIASANANPSAAK